MRGRHNLSRALSSIMMRPWLCCWSEDVTSAGGKCPGLPVSGAFTALKTLHVTSEPIIIISRENTRRSRVIAANCWAIIHQSEAALARVPSQWEGGEAAGARMRGGRESPEQTGGGAPGRGPRGRSAGDKRPGAAQSWPGVQGVQTQSRASCSVLFSGHLQCLLQSIRVNFTSPVWCNGGVQWRGPVLPAPPPDQGQRGPPAPSPAG